MTWTQLRISRSRSFFIADPALANMLNSLTAHVSDLSTWHKSATNKQVNNHAYTNIIFIANYTEHKIKLIWLSILTNQNE